MVCNISAMGSEMVVVLDPFTYDDLDLFQTVEDFSI